MIPVSQHTPDAADKRKFYRQPEVVAAYDRQRFGSPSGAWVNQREIAQVLRLLPDTGRILDLGCGTGRLSQRLAEHGRDVVLCDASDAMLARAVPAVGAPAVLADAFALPFARQSFDAVVALRVAFHFGDIGALIGSVVPLLRPGGRFVFDTYRWTPRAILALAARQWGGKVYIHSPATVKASAEAAGLCVAGRDACFLFSPYLYRLLPMVAVRVLDRAEIHLPDGARARVFWALERPTE
ncbi:MAG TPA: class I SAM-dependent methyltransferase [Chloroflexota bacterium]|nr:class I SAM-dependent methyltransferase [Chloroflexota bacterium]